jgi:hypothetical protein
MVLTAEALMPEEIGGSLPSPLAEELQPRVEALLAAFDADLSAPVADRIFAQERRRVCQGLAELAAMDLLSRSGWMLKGVAPAGGRLFANRPDGSDVEVEVLAFLQREPVDPDSLSRLEAALQRVGSSRRYSVFVRRGLPTGFDPERVRRSVELWLKEVEAGRWPGRYASYEEGSIHFEFGLTGEVASEAGNPVALILGPFLGGRPRQMIEARVVRAMDRRLQEGRLGPVVIFAVADGPWRMGSSYLREFLYGRPAWIRSASGDGPWEAALSDEREPSLFKEPLYANVSALVQLGGVVPGSPVLKGAVHTNPYAKSPLTPGELKLKSLAVAREEMGCPVLRWWDKQWDGWELGA